MRELRRDNSELRDQVARINEDAEEENSLAESDKHTRAQTLQVSGFLSPNFLLNKPQVMKLH